MICEAACRSSNKRSGVLAFCHLLSRFCEGSCYAHARQHMIGMFVFVVISWICLCEFFFLFFFLSSSKTPREIYMRVMCARARA